MTGKRFVSGLVVFGVLIAAMQWVQAADCSECVTCAADPMFVQPDKRDLREADLLRAAGSTEIHNEGLMAVVVLSDGDGECCDSDKKTLVLIGAQGAVEHRVVDEAIRSAVEAFFGRQRH